MRAPAARLVAVALGGVVVGLGAMVAWQNLDTEGHGSEPCSDFVAHLHLPRGAVLWS